MKSFWTPSRDRRLRAYRAGGLSAAEIGRKLGATRNAVIGRDRRLRGIVYQSDIESWARANAKRTAAARKRTALRQERQRKAMRELASAVAAGMPDAKAMARAHRAGATWGQIGAYFSISQQVAYERARNRR
jgi:GcrA cell cycle regulator